VEKEFDQRDLAQEKLVMAAFDQIFLFTNRQIRSAV
jgi:hypothetical protein